MISARVLLQQRPKTMISLDYPLDLSGSGSRSRLDTTVGHVGCIFAYLVPFRLPPPTQYVIDDSIVASAGTQ